MCKCANAWEMCKYANGRLYRLLLAIKTLKHLHILTFAHLHINQAFAY